MINYYQNVNIVIAQCGEMILPSGTHAMLELVTDGVAQQLCDLCLNSLLSFVSSNACASATSAAVAVSSVNESCFSSSSVRGTEFLPLLPRETIEIRLPGQQPVDFSARVTGTSGVKPTGKVELKKGTMVLATAALNNAAAKLSTSALPVGTNMLTASYSGDARNGASTSPAIKQIVLSGGGSCPAIRPILPPVKGSPIISFVP